MIADLQIFALLRCFLFVTILINNNCLTIFSVFLLSQIDYLSWILLFHKDFLIFLLLILKAQAIFLFIVYIRILIPFHRISYLNKAKINFDILSSYLCIISFRIILIVQIVISFHPLYELKIVLIFWFA